MITRPLMHALRAELETALQGVGLDHGVVVSVGSASFSASNATFKIEIAAIGAQGEVLSRERQDWKTYAPLLGIDVSKLDQVISYAGRQWKIIGLRPKSNKCPILAERLPDNKIFKLPRHVAGLKPDIGGYQGPMPSSREEVSEEAWG